MPKPQQVDCRKCRGKRKLSVMEACTGNEYMITCDECDGTGVICGRCAESPKFCDCPEG